MKAERIRRRRPLSVALLAAGAMIPIMLVTAAQADECDKFGTPSYTATRTIDMGKTKISSKVSVAGENEREEMTVNGKAMINVRKGDVLSSYSPELKQGWTQKVPSPPQLDDAAVQKIRSDPNMKLEDSEEGNVSSRVLRRKVGDQWVVVFAFKCREDGVLLERKYPVPVEGKLILAVLTQTDVELKELPDSTFSIPEGIKLAKPGN